MELGAQDFYYYDEGALNSIKNGAKFLYVEAPKKSLKHGYHVVVGGGKLSRKGHLKQAIKYGAIATAADTATGKVVDKAIDKMLGEESSLASDAGNFVKKVGKGFIKANNKAQRNFDNTAIGGYCKAFRTSLKKKLKMR